MFATLFASVGGDDTGDRSPWGDFWFKPVPWKGTPETIDADTALQLTAVLACVRVIAEGRAMLPFQLTRPRAGGGFDQVTDHWLYRVFAQQPSQFQNPFEFAEMMQAHLLLRGRAYAEIVGSTLDDLQLVPLHPDRVKLERLTTGSWRFRVQRLDGTEDVLSRSQMFYLRGLTLDGVNGVSPITLARASLAVGLAAQDYGARFFNNDAKPGGWIEYPGQFKDEQQRDNWRKSWQKAQAGMNRGKTAVLEFGMKYHELGVTNDDAQFLETRKFSRSEIAGLMRVPPHMIGDLERATFSNIEQQSIEFVQHCLTPWLVRWEQAIQYTFLDPTNPDDAGLQVRFPTRALLRGDMAARAQFYSRGILDGWLTRNEARLDDDRNPLPNLDEPLRPLNMGDASDPSPAEQDAAKPGAPMDNSGTTNRDAQLRGSEAAHGSFFAEDRARAVATAAVERVMRKEVAHGFEDVARHAAFVSEVLAVPLPDAMKYAEWRAGGYGDDPVPMLTALARKGKWE